MSEKPITKETPIKGKDKTAAVIMSAVFVALLVGATVLNGEVLRGYTYSHYLNKIYLYLIAGGVFACSFVILAGFMFINYREGLKNKRIFAATGTAIVLNYVIFLAAGYLSVYAMPLCFAAILVSSLVDRRLGFTVNLVCVLQFFTYALLTIDAGAGADSGMLFAASLIGACSILFNIVSMGRINRNTGRAGFIAYLLLFSVMIMPPALLLTLLYGETLGDFAFDLLYLAIGAFAQILLLLFFIPLMERIFMITTNSRLAELCDLRQPLLKRLMTEAPATFNHSQTVANLAESCASALNQNVYMARAASLYHDIGKLNNIEYFTENQADGTKNPHDDITPELSAEIIHKHTMDGFQMAAEAKLPKDLAAITMEHQGTTVLKYFYDKAKRMTDGDVDMEFYRYKGAKPTTTIAAIIMICDSSEAAIRAMQSPDKEKVARLVDKIIYDRIADGQFDNCEVTIKDLAIIRQTIAEMSTGLYHTRIEYPK